MTILSSRITLSASSSLSAELSGSDRMIRVSSNRSSKCDSSILALPGVGISGGDDDSKAGAIVAVGVMLRKKPPAAAMINRITTAANSVFLFIRSLLITVQSGVNLQRCPVLLKSLISNPVAEGYAGFPPVK